MEKTVTKPSFSLSQRSMSKIFCQTGCSSLFRFDMLSIKMVTINI